MTFKGIIRSICGVGLSALLVGAIHAQQSDRMLAGGEPPLMQSTVDKLIDFFEFGLHGKFDQEQRAEFRTQRIAEWKSDPKARENYLSILETRSKLVGLDDAKLAEARVTIQNYLLDMIKGQPDDATSKLLRAVYENGLRNSVSSGRVNVAATSDSSSLIGTWGTGSVSGIGFVNQTNGSYSNGGGTQVQYTFKPGGRYEYGSLTEQTMYSCSTKFSTFKTGIVEIRGGTLTFVPQTATFTSEDSCIAKNNYKKPAGLNRETYNWRVERDADGTKLCLQNDTVNGCAYKR